MIFLGFSGRGGFSANTQNDSGGSSHQFSRAGGSSGTQGTRFGRGGFSNNQNNDFSFNDVKSRCFGNIGGTGFGNNRDKNNADEIGQDGGFRRFYRNFSNMSKNIIKFESFRFIVFKF